MTRSSKIMTVLGALALAIVIFIAFPKTAFADGLDKKVIDKLYDNVNVGKFPDGSPFFVDASPRQNDDGSYGAWFTSWSGNYIGYLNWDSAKNFTGITSGKVIEKGVLPCDIAGLSFSNGNWYVESYYYWEDQTKAVDHVEINQYVKDKGGSWPAPPTYADKKEQGYKDEIKRQSTSSNKTGYVNIDAPGDTDGTLEFEICKNLMNSGSKVKYNFWQGKNKYTVDLSSQTAINAFKNVTALNSDKDSSNDVWYFGPEYLKAYFGATVTATK